MATIKMVPSIAFVISAVFLFTASSSCEAQELKACKFNAIYQFGDSVSDTGNSIVEFPTARHSHFPYGQTINNATGRSSDGLLIIDYIAQSAGLPLLDPYENKTGTNFTHGVNFAFAGATAMSVEELKKRKIQDPRYNKAPLDVQLQRFEAFLNGTCHNAGCRSAKLKSALFMVGEIGGNDYNYEFQKMPSKTAKKMPSKPAKTDVVPDVVKVIVKAVKQVINRGATRVVVPGIFPLGCSPIYLQGFKKNNTSAYDKYGCLKAYNDVIVCHNEKLQKALKELKKKYPTTHVVYGDLYNAFLHVLDNSSKLGFRELTKACCGGGGEYNYNSGAECGGDKDYTVCANPKEYISWDGQHLTQQTYKQMAQWLIRDIIPKLQCKGNA